MENKGILDNKLREFRFKHDQITQEDLADALRVSRQTILAIEHGKFQSIGGSGFALGAFFRGPR